MRISTEVDDRAYHPHATQCRYFLEGAERNNVVIADEEARFAVQIRLDEFGNVVKDKAGQPCKDKFHGAVRIDCAEWLRDAMTQPQEEADTLSAAILGMITCP